MTSFILCQCFAFLLLVSSTYCHEHHSHDKDDKWTVFVSQIQSFWKTEPSETQTETFVITKSTLSGKDPSNYHNHHRTTEDDVTSFTPRIEIMNGTSTFIEVKEKVKLGLAWLISIPIVGIIFLICCCYCCCKCCAAMCASEDKIIVMNSGAVAPAQQPQVIVQHPIIQTMQQAPREMHHYPPTNPQWVHPNFQQQPPPYYPMGGGIDNPNFQFPTAPSNMSPNKY